MKKSSIFKSLKWIPIFAVPLLSVMLVETAAAKTHNIAVTRHNTVSISASRVDSIFRGATSLLRTDSGAGDVSCNVTLRRSGRVRVFRAGDGIIDNLNELNQAINAPGKVTVVRRINFCGRLGSGIRGCATNGAPRQMVVVPNGLRAERATWAHEFGHTQGLLHRGGDNRVLMKSNGNAGRNRINRRECNAFRR